MTAALRRLLGSDELEGDLRARLVCGALLVFYCHTFGAWHGEHAPALSSYAVERLDVLPGPLIAALGGPAFLPPLWTLLHLSLLYVCGLLGLLSLLRKDCTLSLALLAFLFLNKAYYYLSDLRLAADFHHLHLALTLLFLLSRGKVFFFRLGLVAGYWLLAAAKLNAGWLGAEYFLSTRGNVPLIPDSGWVLAWACPLWAAWEFLGPLLWFSRRRLARDIALWVFAASHLFYAAVGRPDFALFMLPALVTALWNMDRPVQSGYRFSKGQLLGWASLGLLVAAASGRLPAPETNRAGACRVVVEKGDKRLEFEVTWPWRVPTALADGSRAEAGVPSYKGELFVRGEPAERFPWKVIVRDGPLILWNPYPFLALPYEALDPYVLRLYGERLCRDYRPDRLSLRFDLQLNGRPERARLLDSEDFCAAAHR